MSSLMLSLPLPRPSPPEEAIKKWRKADRLTPEGESACALVITRLPLDAWASNLDDILSYYHGEYMRQTYCMK